MSDKETVGGQRVLLREVKWPVVKTIDSEQERKTSSEVYANVL